MEIEPKVIHSNVPLIDRTMGNSFSTAKEFDSKAKEFYDKYKDKSEKELLEICKQKGYADYAQKTARQLLDEKNK
ncbi:hypothetical protein [Maribellus maritimus]|uniref:hypothetical protein n=1 Tax=Maribellus maritimus TaxID=2870838 RepID=UPI001EEA92E4|nr:hypothetical protein [Maribellus maritimus]MCG6191263.1 hypothetical protein [Maribellus maritimus]